MTKLANQNRAGVVATPTRGSRRLSQQDRDAQRELNIVDNDEGKYSNGTDHLYNFIAYASKHTGDVVCTAKAERPKDQADCGLARPDTTLIYAYGKNRLDAITNVGAYFRLRTPKTERVDI